MKMLRILMLGCLFPSLAFGTGTMTTSVGAGTITMGNVGNVAPVSTNAGPSNPNTMADDSGVGTISWNNPNNSQTQNNVYASCEPDGNLTTTHYLKVTNFGFSIPTGATINGIKVEVDKYSTLVVPGTDDFKDYQTRIVKGGTIGSTDRSDLNNWGATDTDTYVTYGSNSDLWGDTWTPSDINNSGFGFAISGRNTCSFCVAGIADDVFIDHIRITIYYTTAGSNTSVTITK